MNIILEHASIVEPGRRSFRGDIVIRDGQIAQVGSDLHTHRDYRSFQRLGLHSAAVLPGLVDAHVHLFNYALTLDRVRLQDCRSISTCLRRIDRFASTRGPRDWIVGEGYLPSQFQERREPTAAELDAVTGGRPAFIFAKDHHSAWVNSATLRQAGITRATPDQPNSTIVRDHDGRPTGILRERIAYEQVFRLIPMPPAARLQALFRKASEIALSKGVTSVHSFDSPEALPYLMKWAEQGKIPLRIAHYARYHALPELQRAGIRYGSGTGMLWFAGIKMFADGTLGSRTADCFDAYTDDPGNSGLPTMTVPEMKQAGRIAAKLGFPCAIHAIGDRAVARAIEVIAAMPKLSTSARHRIEHIQLIRPSEIATLRTLGIIASMQPSHLPSDIPMIRQRWRDRANAAYRFASLVRAGIVLAGGSDLPIEPIDPLAGIATAIRHGAYGSVRAFNSRERLSPHEALAAFTTGPAFALGREQSLGRIAPGYAADLTILERNPLTCPVVKIPGIHVLASIVGGKVRYADGLRF